MMARTDAAQSYLFSDILRLTPLFHPPSLPRLEAVYCYPSEINYFFSFCRLHYPRYPAGL
ncbi:hypothetical protein BJX76DRAFT_323420 [Aspergillus varians]